MHALRQIHKALVPGGALLDMHPVPPSTRAEIAGRILGEFEDDEFMSIVAAGEAEIERSGLFVHESEVEFDYRERYEDPAKLLKDIREGWEGCRIPPELERKMRNSGGPVDVWERVVLRRFTRSPPRHHL